MNTSHLTSENQRKGSGTACASLSRLLGSTHSIEHFLADIWEQTHLHISRADNPELEPYFRTLLTVDDVDRLLTTVYAAGPRRPDAVRMGQGGVMIPPGEYLFNVSQFLAEVDVERVLKLYQSGASIILNAVHEALPAVADLCSDLSSFHGVPVRANAYVTPPKSQGFPVHHDTHDVFLLQMTGEKHWKLSGSPVPLATSPQAAAKHECETPPLSLQLRSGELLYIPRGLRHEGIASDMPSIHLTLGVYPFTWSQLMVDMITELEQEEVAFRRSVDAQLSCVDAHRDVLEQTIAALCGRLNDVDRVQRAARRKMQGVAERERKVVRGGFARIAFPPEITSTTRVRARAAAHIVPMTSTTLVMQGTKVLSLPARTEPCLRAVFANRSSLSAADLPESLDDEGKLVLIRRLVREGMVEVAFESGNTT